MAVGAGAAIVLGPIDISARSQPDEGSYEAMRVLFLDVDQADATLVQLPGGRSLLVDAGGTMRGSFPVGERIVAPVLWHAGVRRLDYLALTHADPDHVGRGLRYSKTFGPARFGRVCRCHGPRVSVSFRRSPAKAGRHGAGCKRGTSSVSVTSKSHVWHPPPPDWERQRVRNDDSLVLELRHGQVSIILTGDIGPDVESTLATRIPPAPVRVLKIPHHGSAVRIASMC